MKKYLSVFCAVVLAMLIVPINARADIIYEPWDDPFYEEHRDECVYLSRSYTANGPNGDVTVYESPESARKEATAANGETLWISYTYEDADGIVWGFWESFEKNIAGWVPMDYLELIYDGISFEEEYGNRFVPVAGSLDAEELTDQTIYFWQYPGSTTNIAVDLTENYRPDFQTSYTDADGNEWVRCGYYMGIRGYWINLDNPTADFDALYPNGIEAVPPETEPAPTEGARVEEIAPKSNNGVKLAVIAAVVATVTVTAVLLYLLKKKA